MSHPSPPRTIGLLTPYLGGIYSGSVIAGAVREAQRHGARLIIIQESPRGLYQSRLAWDLVDDQRPGQHERPADHLDTISSINLHSARVPLINSLSKSSSAL